ncbi:MAG: AAA family ATPase [Limnohabitans sp.]|nr:AAA family ATPase [Limnohabitans sp.]
MKITKVNIPENIGENDGLKDIKMQKLSNLVIIAGKNGSGKTRILNKIFNNFKKKPSKSRKIELQNTLSANESRINVSKNGIENLKTDLKTQEENNSNEITFKKSIETAENHINKITQELKWNYIETDVESDVPYSFIKFVPTKLGLTDPNRLNKYEVKQRACEYDSLNTDLISEIVFPKIQFIQDRWHHATHQNFNGNEEEKANAISDYEQLQEIIKIFFSTSLERNIDGEATIFGFPLGQSNLSYGQIIIIQFLISIYKQEQAMENLILVLDEPENHLHPSALIETIDKIVKCVSNGQVWIATHSIPLISHFDPSHLWYVNDGEIKHAGKIPDQVLSSLLGDEERRGKLQDFIGLPAQYATINYCIESLFEPGVVLTEAQDPQSRQIKKQILSFIDKKETETIKILDYGVGKGRLISNIYELDGIDQTNLKKSIDYVGYDKYSSDKDICISALERVYDDASKRYYNDFSELFTDHDRESFDIVIMCNVLHEIESKNWINLFKKDGEITKCLQNNGILLLVEDQQIPVGEKAYQNGFLVLDTPDLKDLFKIDTNDQGFICDDRNNGRLKAHQIPKHILERIDLNSKNKAIKSVQEAAKNKIQNLRESNEANYQNGKLHGFYLLQYANASLILSESNI